MRVKICIFFIALAANAVLAQESHKTVLKGKINANSIDLEGIYVINLRTEKSTITEKEGRFSIAAIPGDSLLFSAIHLKEIRIVLEQRNFEEEFIVKMESSITQLKEVVVKRYDNINAVALGISTSGGKHLTQAEKHLETATGLNSQGSQDVHWTGRSASLDPVFNFLSGRTAMLKKDLEAEGKLSFIDQIDNMFNEDYFSRVLKIPFEYIKGFKYYVVENDGFTKVLKSKNKTNIEFWMVGLAEKYNKMIAGEK